MIPRYKFQILVFGKLIRWNEIATGNHWIEDHHTPAVLLNVPSDFKVIRIRRDKLDPGWISMEQYVVSSLDYFAGTVLKSRGWHWRYSAEEPGITHTCIRYGSGCRSWRAQSRVRRPEWHTGRASGRG